MGFYSSTCYHYFVLIFYNYTSARYFTISVNAFFDLLSIPIYHSFLTFVKNIKKDKDLTF